MVNTQVRCVHYNSKEIVKFDKGEVLALDFLRTSLSGFENILRNIAFHTRANQKHKLWGLSQ